MKNGLRIILLLALTVILAMGSALGEDTPVEDIVPVLELPELTKGHIVELTAEYDPMIGPHSGCYKTRSGQKNPSSYADPSITVNIGTGRIYNTNYTYARVKIATPGQIRVKTVTDTLSQTKTLNVTTLAKRANAIVAINGVLEGDKSMGSQATGVKIAGPVMIQGTWWRPVDESKIESWKQDEGMDTLVIDDQGNLVVIEKGTWGEIYQQILDLENSPVNIFCFGPALVVDGEPQYGYSNRQMSTNRQAQRAAICQTGPLEYLLITSEGPEQENKAGLKLDQFIELIVTRFPEVQTAYNLDGGNSSTIVFRGGSSNWTKINSKGQKIRDLRDIIYFADAWTTGGK